MTESKRWTWIAELHALRTCVKPLFVSPRAHERDRSAVKRYNETVHEFGLMFADVQRLVARGGSPVAEIEALKQLADALREHRDRLSRAFPT